MSLDRLIRAGFISWALLLFTLTHWPDMRVEIEGVQRTDLLGHLVGYSVWTFLIIASGFVGRRGSWRSVGLGMPVALLYAGLDELSQGIPVLQRDVSFDDFAANAIGVWIGASVWAVALLVRDARSVSLSPDP